MPRTPPESSECLRILYVAMQFDYGDPRRGLSFEESNFKSALEGMGHQVIHYDFMAKKQKLGLGAMRRDLVKQAAALDVDVVFMVLFTNEIDPKTLKELRVAAQAPTINWFADDHWRFEGFSRRMAKHLDWSVTTDADAISKYHASGLDQVILSQWACNKYLYHPLGNPVDGTTTFVGQPHGNRREVIAELERNDVCVICYGHGWQNGRISTGEMIRTFQKSSINLNLSNSSRSSIPEVVYRKILRIGGGFGDRPAQIKGRTFEIPGCGGFQLSERVPYLDQYFDLETEISTYSSVSELIEKIRYFTVHDDERTAIANAGYQRVVRQHTYDHRFREIFDTAGIVRRTRQKD
jgi:spore maturation protein CgeB